MQNSTVGHKSHAPCFHKRYIEAEVMIVENGRRKIRNNMLSRFYWRFRNRICDVGVQIEIKIKEKKIRCEDIEPMGSKKSQALTIG